jgi:hypothetical protein
VLFGHPTNASKLFLKLYTINTTYSKWKPVKLLYKTLSTILVLVFLQASRRLQRPIAFPAPRSKRALPVTKPTRQLTNTSSD